MGAMPSGSPYALEDEDDEDLMPLLPLPLPLPLPLSARAGGGRGGGGGVSSHTEVDDAKKCQPLDALSSAPCGRTRSGVVVAAISASVATKDADARRGDVTEPSQLAVLSRLSRTSRWRREWYGTDELELVERARGRRLGEVGSGGCSRPVYGGRRSCMTTEGSGSTGRLGRTTSRRVVVVGIIWGRRCRRSSLISSGLLGGRRACRGVAVTTMLVCVVISTAIHT